MSTPAFAQENTSESETIVVTGSRIMNPNLVANSPVVTASGDDVVKSADITLDTFLNTLPQVNPAGTTTSNNPGNGGQSNINLRGLGSNRNLVLVNGRRPMVSATNMAVDLNTISQQLIQRIEVVTGGAGATYGADAIAGVVNIILKDDFEGIDLRATYSNTIPKTDARDYQLSGLIGGNFADNRGNITISFEYAKRQQLIKEQRPFAAQATSTTGTPPTGRLVEASSNGISQAAINAIFASYGVAADQAPLAGLSQIHFNSDGTLFGGGIFNSPLNVSNYRYAPGSAAAANENFFPDFYSYNFDAINILQLPLERKSAFMRGHYEISPAVEIFTQAAYTEYLSKTALAPTPIGTRIYNNNTPGGPSYATSPLITPGILPGRETTNYITNSIIPVTNPWIPADLAALLATRTGDDPAIVGSGATEPFRMSIRTLGTGLRENTVENKLLQGLVGLRGQIAEGWRYETYYSWGETTISSTASGNVNVQNLQALLEAPDGGLSLCAGGYNPFGIQPMSQACADFLDETGFTKQTFTQKIAQAYVQGDLAELPAGTLSMVLGAEQRKFSYKFDPGALAGPIAGFNTSTPDHGTNKFTDVFGELYIPIAKDASFADDISVSLGYRYSVSDFNDIQNNVDGDRRGSSAYKAELSWAVNPALRFRLSYQHSVRAPNFNELFVGGSSFVQAFDPCSVSTEFRKNGGATARQACIDSGVSASGVDNFVATPGAQVNLSFAGNPDLKPEKGDTITAGVAFNVAGISGSLDYYNIRVKDPIFGPDTNLFIAACYGYQGDFDDATRATYCSGVRRSGSNLSSVDVPVALGGDGTGQFRQVNQGLLKTSGLDLQLAYRLPTTFVSEESSVNFGLLMNYLIDFKREELPGVTLDYAGTVSYFGQGLGTSYPRWRGNLNIDWKLVDAITLSSRIRYIDSMKNRASVQFPTEVQFTGTSSVWYFDFAAQAKVDAYTFRVGVNNAFNRKPPTYSPNVQSGTDPSLFDVIGRRAYVSVGLRF